MELHLVDQNFKITKRYIESEQKAMDAKQAQIFEIDNQVKKLISDICQLRKK